MVLPTYLHTIDRSAQYVYAYKYYVYNCGTSSKEYKYKYYVCICIHRLVLLSFLRAYM